MLLQSVSALLWDVARMWFHESHQVQGPELSPELLQSWMANYTEVLKYAREKFPEVGVQPVSSRPLGYVSLAAYPAAACTRWCCPDGA